MNLQKRARLIIFIGLLGLSSCSTKSPKGSPTPTSASASGAVKETTQGDSKVATQGSTQGATQNVATKSAPSKESGSKIAMAQEMEIKLKSNKETTPPTTSLTAPVSASPGTAAATSKEVPPKEVAEKTAAHHREVGPVPADKAIGWLKNGNTRHIKGYLRKDGQTKGDRERLANGQHPHSIVLSCSDSRVPPELVFDQKLGEIFTVRTAGENPDAAAIASIEYALDHLGANLIVVMGHESCGAVKAAALAAEGERLGSPFLERLVSQIKARLQPGRSTQSPGFVQEGWENVNGVTQELMKKSEIIREAVNSGSVKIQPALYHLASGQVEWAPPVTTISK